MSAAAKLVIVIDEPSSLSKVENGMRIVDPGRTVPRLSIAYFLVNWSDEGAATVERGTLTAEWNAARRCRCGLREPLARPQRVPQFEPSRGVREESSLGVDAAIPDADLADLAAEITIVRRIARRKGTDCPVFCGGSDC